MPEGSSAARWRLLTLGTLALAGGAPGPAGAPVLGPRKLALLAYLAFAARPLTRDHLAELFWGDRDEVRARHSLREALSALRHLLGPDALPRGGERVALAPAAPLDVDLRALRAAVTAGNAAGVVALYAGPFFDGVHTGGSSAFEAWVDAQRADAAHCFADACASECRRLREEGAWAARAALARRWLAAAPLDPKPARVLLRSVAAPGTREALRLADLEYTRLVERLAADFGVAPDASVVEIAAGYAAALTAAPEPAEPPGAADATDRDVIAHDAGSVAADAGPPAHAATRERHTRRRVAFAALGTVALAYLGASAIPRGGADARVPPARAVVGILPVVAPDRTPDGRWLADAVPKLLGDAIGRAADVEVVEVAPPAAGGADPLDGARRAGATVAVSAALGAGGGRYLLRLDARDLRDTSRHRRVVVSDSVVFAVVERGAVALAGALPGASGAADASRLAGVETRSVEAYRAYLDALRLTAEGRDDEASRALDRAIATDSGFVTAVAERRRRMARPVTAAADDSARRLVAAFARNAARATPYDRADLEVLTAFYGGDHARAERLGAALAERYPHDPRAQRRYVDVLTHHGRFAEAIAVTRRALAAESAAAPRARCAACLDYGTLAELFALAGRPAEAEGAARAAVARAPDRPAAWIVLSGALATRARWAEAVATSERARTLAPADRAYAFEPERRLVEAGRYDEAGDRLRPWLAAADGELAAAAADVEAVRLRELGRHADALRVLAAGARGAPAQRVVFALVQGASAAAIGDAARTEAAYAAAGPRLAGPAAAGATSERDTFWRQNARAFAWTHALLADALFVAGEAGGRPVDARRLAALADSLEVVGSASYYARDWRLHHHVRGLVAAREGRWSEAAAQFRLARWGGAGWTRTLVELARAELALGRPDSALAALRDARAGVLDGMGRYATHADVDCWTARAFAAAGRVDSAHAYAARVRRAWAGADPAVRRALPRLPR